MRRDDLQRLKEQKAHIHAEMLELNEGAESRNRAFTAEEDAKFDELAGEYRSLDDRVKRAEEIDLNDADVLKDRGLRDVVTFRSGDGARASSMPSSARRSEGRECRTARNTETRSGGSSRPPTRASSSRTISSSSGR